MKNKKEVALGTFKIGVNLKSYVFDGKSWKVTQHKFLEALRVIELYKANGAFDLLIDLKNPKFLKGQMSSDGKAQGGRIFILPDGKKLDGAFSLFSPGLTIHDEKSNIHWDVIYLNPSGKFAYHYAMDKKNKSIFKKYKKVHHFEELYPQLEKKAFRALSVNSDTMAIPFWTLLQTHMRIGNEIYYKAHGHKGLTTLKKKDIKIKASSVVFSFLGKDGVPQKIEKNFPKVYISRLKKILSGKKPSDFVFANSRGHLLMEEDFKREFKKFIGVEFYPHIVRSYFATSRTEIFLAMNKHPTKTETVKFLESVAEELGHKKMSKKTGEWEDSYSVTICHYIDPKLAGRLKKFMKK